MQDYEKVAKKITRTLFFSQSVVSAALITTATVNAIAGAELSGVVAWAGLPATVLLGSVALGSLLWGILMERIGRRGGLSIGLTLGAAGGLLSGAAIGRGSFLIFLVGMAMYGLAQSAMQLGRFAAAEVNPAAKRGRAIASVVLGGTVGSILGPLLVGPTGVIANQAGLDELVGPYGISLLLFILATLIVFSQLRPDPLEIARDLALREKGDQSLDASPGSIPDILRRPGVLVAILAMVIGQAVMVMIMVITSLHMKALDHPLSFISIVISSHTFGMFAFSVLSGRLVDRIGREPVIMIGAGFLILAGLSAGISPDVLPIAAALFLLGLGWNLCYVGGSTLLTDLLSNAEQSRMQGVNDLLVGLASAVGSLGSGFVFAAVGYQVMGIIGAAVAVLPLAVVFRWTRSTVRLASA